MKQIRHLLLVLCSATLATPMLSAQTHHHHAEEYSPTVYITSKEHHKSDAHHKVVDRFKDTHRCGFQQTQPPQFIFTSQDKRFALGIGGYVNLRSSYDFNGAMGNIDFVPYDIPMSQGYANKQRIMMDASTSRLFVKAVVQSEKLGQVLVYADMDFRGGAEFTYIPRLRSAYINLKGFTIGRDVTTFCDLNAAPTTIDFQGPNAYNFRFATMIRYEHSFLDNHLKAGVAAEMPSVSGTYGETLMAIPQRVPDFPIYLQYSWGKNRDSHIRASAVFRDMYLYNSARSSEDDLFGWGVQFSGNIHITKYLELFMNGIYGEGITRYINDLMGSGLDFTPRPNDATRVQATPMFGWQAAAQINLLPNLFVSGGYSAVTVRKKNGIYSEDMYKQGQYIFGNVFWNLTPRFALAAEYLYAHRKNMDGNKAHANRINLLAKYSF